MQRWEYKVVMVTPSSNGLMAREEIAARNLAEEMPLTQMLSSLGEQGFELVSALPSPDGGILIYTLMKLKP